jgi:hypothetical protein
MKEAGSAVPEDVARALHALKGWRGVTGAFSFDEGGDADKPVLFSVVHSGRFEYLPAPATASATGTDARARLRP